MGLFSTSRRLCRVTLNVALQASATCAASCPAPGSAFSAEDAEVLARVIRCRRSVFPKHFSGAPIDRLVPTNSARPEPLCSSAVVSFAARKWLIYAGTSTVS